MRRRRRQRATAAAAIADGQPIQAHASERPAAAADKHSTNASRRPHPKENHSSSSKKPNYRRNLGRSSWPAGSGARPPAARRSFVGNLLKPLQLARVTLTSCDIDSAQLALRRAYSVAKVAARRATAILARRGRERQLNVIITRATTTNTYFFKLASHKRVRIKLSI